eukprot:5924679-Amphidinium_carterae.1
MPEVLNEDDLWSDIPFPHSVGASTHDGSACAALRHNTVEENMCYESCAKATLVSIIEREADQAGCAAETYTCDHSTAVTQLALLAAVALKRDRCGSLPSAPVLNFGRLSQLLSYHLTLGSVFPPTPGKIFTAAACSELP